jgi:hypothetical protein
MARSRPMYTTSALRLAQVVFNNSAAEPTKLWLDGGQLGDELPDGRLLLLPLRDLLLRPQTSPATRDQVWRELILKARANESWLVAALGMAMPGLRTVVRTLLSAGLPVDRDDLESTIATGFVDALRKVDVDDVALCARLRSGGRKAGEKLLYEAALVDSRAGAPLESRVPPPPWGHPDFVLVDAVSAGVLSLDEARLIGVTRLEHLAVKDVAEWLGVPATTVTARRRRAEQRVATAIAAGELEGTLDSLLG